MVIKLFELMKKLTLPDRHACPGRFFAIQMLKLMLGHVLVNYEFEPLAERPEFSSFGDLTMPPSTKVKVRRRREKV